MDASLDSFLKKVQQGPVSLSPTELNDLVLSFTPTQLESRRSKAYLTLSVYCQSIRSASTVRGNQPDPATERLAKEFERSLLDRLNATEEDSLVIAATFWTALFQVDPESASFIFQKDGALSSIMEAVDISPTPSLNLAVAHLIAQACSHKHCRIIITSEAIEWLQANSRPSVDSNVRAAAAIALIKLSKGSAADNAEITQVDSPPLTSVNEDDLAELMKGLVIGGVKSSAQDAIEGLAYLSVDPRVKEHLSRDAAFLKAVFNLAPKKASSDAPNNSLLYGILLLIGNICAYRPRLTEEQQNIQKLKKMTASNKNVSSSSDGTSKLDDDGYVKERVRRMINAGVLSVFAATPSYMDSPGIRSCASKALLSIAEDMDHRGKVLQSGGAKILGLIIKQDFTTTKQAETKDNVPLEAIQALAKLAITSSPMQVFGPNEGAMYDIIRPFSVMVQHESSTLLQRFEAMMALTNLATQSAELASRIAKADGLMNRVELLLLEDHVLVRRAAMELVCNLIVGSDDVFEKYGGGENNARSRSKLQVLLALSDVDDLPTRAAASGALATLTISPNACLAIAALQEERHRAMHILTLLIDPLSVPADKKDDVDELETESSLVHRGVVCVRNLFINTSDEVMLRFMVREAQGAGLVLALSKVVKGEVGKVEEGIVRPAVEALKRIAEYVK